MSEVVPQTGGYMVAAYIVTAVILVGYGVLLARRTRKNTSKHI
jgi:LPXTG-motif cell wall-anchored protein